MACSASGTWRRQTLLGPDNYDRIKGWRIYEVTCDDPGLSKPAFLAAKNAERPVQGEVAALDDYIEHFVWGGLQRTHRRGVPVRDLRNSRLEAEPRQSRSRSKGRAPLAGL